MIIIQENVFVSCNKENLSQIHNFYQLQMSPDILDMHVYCATHQFLIIPSVKVYKDSFVQ